MRQFLFFSILIPYFFCATNASFAGGVEATWGDLLPSALVDEYIDPVSLSPIDFDRENIIWLRISPVDTPVRNSELVKSFLFFEGYFWRPYKAHTIISLLQARYQEKGDLLLEEEAVFNDPLTRNPVSLGDLVLLSFGKNSDLRLAEFRLGHPIGAAEGQIDFFFGELSSDGSSTTEGIHFNAIADYFIVAKYENWIPDGVTKMYFLEFDNYYKQGKYLAAEKKMLTDSWYFPDGSHYKVLYDEQGVKTGQIEMHTRNGEKKTIRLCEFPSYVSFN